MKSSSRLIVALDGDWNLDYISGLSAGLASDVGMLKIGKRMFTRFGPDVVRAVTNRSAKVFLDLKYHDIPNTVADACKEAVNLGVSMLNIHAGGGRTMMMRAAEAVDEQAAKLGVKKPLLIAVTVLTSFNEEGLQELGITGKIPEQVYRLATLAKECGMDGVVASPLEIELIRASCGKDFKIVTPGVRPANNVKVADDDQKRVMTPGDAVKAGADYIVVGRPIYGSDNPAMAAKQIVSEIEG